jgi:hypothetical protein
VRAREMDSAIAGARLWLDVLSLVRLSSNFVAKCNYHTQCVEARGGDVGDKEVV